MILSHFLNLFTPTVYPINTLKKVKSNEKRPGKKLCCAFYISVEYKIKIKFTIFLEYTKYISSRVVKFLNYYKAFLKYLYTDRVDLLPDKAFGKVDHFILNNYTLAPIRSLMYQF